MIVPIKKRIRNGSSSDKGETRSSLSSGELLRTVPSEQLVFIIFIRAENVTGLLARFLCSIDFSLATTAAAESTTITTALHDVEKRGIINCTAYVCMYICMYVHTCVWMYVHMDV